MREIIFRAWDGDKYHYGGFVVHPDGKMEYPEGGWDVHGCDDGDLLEQYTGLKDKNGNKIFEGDIIRTDGIDGVLNWECYCDEETYDFSFWPIGHEYCSTHNGAFDEDEREVIGNIHDNPELLEGGTC